MFDRSISLRNVRVLSACMCVLVLITLTYGNKRGQNTSSQKNLVDESLVKERQNLSCAIVLNSGLFANPKYEYGSLIDMHDVIIRFNMAPTAGFEKAVGSKTAYMWTYHSHFAEFKEKMNTAEYRATKLIIGPYPWDARLLNESGIPSSRYIIPNASELASVCKSDWLTEKFVADFPSKRCSSGVSAFIYFRFRCSELSIFGLYSGRVCDIPLHYFSTVKSNCSDPDEFDHSHNFTYEHEMFKKYGAHQEGVKFFPP